MIRKTRLFTPGPTPLLPAAQFAMAAADIHHRTPEFRALYTRVLGQLKEFVGTQNDVILLSSSGTGAMEASVSNLTSPGDRVLVLTAGKFGERWTGIAKAFGCEVDVVSAPYGESAYTPAVALIAALGAAFDYIAAQAATPENPKGDLAEGRRKLVDNAETIAAMTRAAVTALGFKLFAPDAPSAAATAVYAPEGVDSGTIVKELKSRFAAVITNGQGEMKGKIFRIAHLGFFDYMDTIALIGALEQVVAKAPFKPKDFAFGQGLIAAQKVYAEATHPKAEDRS